jgi:hypothetical protein
MVLCSVEFTYYQLTQKAGLRYLYAIKTKSPKSVLDKWFLAFILMTPAWFYTLCLIGSNLSEKLAIFLL